MESEDVELEIELEQEPFVGGGKCNCYRVLTDKDYNWNTQTQTAEKPFDSIALWLLDTGTYLVSQGTKLTLTTENLGGEGIIDPTAEFWYSIYKIEVVEDLQLGNIVVKMYDNLYNGLGWSIGIVDSNGSMISPIHSERFGYGGPPWGNYGNLGDIYIDAVFNNSGEPSEMYVLETMDTDPDTGEYIYNWKKVELEQ